MLYCGRYLQASNLVVDENFRARGAGKQILNYLENKARDLGCDKMVLDSYTENKKSHSLYFGEDFYIRGFHFMKDLT
jgi:GNAT superfamily N-acetyltransferase